jgi:hypothetical protein
MPNPVQDKLSDTDTDKTWQVDTYDSAVHPQNNETMGSLSPTGLGNELRSIKEVVKRYTRDSMWINYAGDLAAPSPVTAVVVDATTCTLAGDWRGIAHLGRSVRVTDSAGVKRVSTIVPAPTYDNGTMLTTVVLQHAIIPVPPSVLTLRSLEFSAIDTTTGYNPFWLFYDVGRAVNQGDFVVPVDQGGTGTVNPMGPDVTGSADQNLVEQIQNVPVVGGVPNEHDVLAGDTIGRWRRLDIGVMLNLAQTIAGTVGQINLASESATVPFPVVLKWMQVALDDVLLTATATWATPFVSACYSVWAILQPPAGAQATVFKANPLVLFTPSFGVNDATFVACKVNNLPTATGVLIYVVAIGT